MNRPGIAGGGTEKLDIGINGALTLANDFVRAAREGRSISERKAMIDHFYGLSGA